MKLLGHIILVFSLVLLLIDISFTLKFVLILVSKVIAFELLLSLFNNKDNSF